MSVVTWLLLAETVDRLISAANARRAHGDGGDVLLESANDKATRGRRQSMARANRRHVILCLVAWLVPLLVMTSVNATTDDDSEYLIADHCVVTVTPIYALTAGVASFFGPAALLLLLTAVLGLVAACSTRVTAHSTHYQVQSMFIIILSFMFLFLSVPLLPRPAYKCYRLAAT